jgi:hypothetical protein
MVLLCASGCHVLLPLSSRSGDGPADSWEADASPPDTGVDVDVDAASAGDAKVADSRVVLVPTALSCADAGCCLEADPIANPHCTKTCVQPDCDGVPDYRDPWPQHCNRAVVAIPFFDAQLPWLHRSYCNNDIRVSCGELVFSLPPNYTLWAWLKEAAGVLVRPEDLVEVRVVPDSNTPSWMVRIEVPGNGSPGDTCFPWSFQPRNGRACRIEHSPGQGLSLVNGPQASVAVSGYDPTDLVLQSFVSGGAHHCRVSSAGQLRGEVTVPLKASVPQNGTSVLIDVLNSDQVNPTVIRLDYLRVFEGL